MAESWTERFEKWWNNSEVKYWREAMRPSTYDIAERAFMSGAAGERVERVERVRDNQRPMCSVTSLSGALGEPLGCGFKQGHEGAHSWASLPTFLVPQNQEGRQ